MILFSIIVLIFVLLLVFWSLQKNENTNIVNSFWSKLETIFIEDSNDKMWSSNRVAYIFTMLLSNLIIWGGILFLIINTKSFPNIPESVIVVYGISNGIASFTKVWQKREERYLQNIENKE